ncbi:MAG: NAD-dependent epimerase/dehydratase family protein [Fuerstiella sp.]|nr:NAD-dependent epimerase/dehydratase family protein [Fuerstiella sp.]MCP4855765.1 NAD-dependent epimerase/dehydratase family protein [Fuerstiella sp.]
MQLTDANQILVTGATGLVGSHVAEQARQRGIHVRALCRASADTTLLQDWGVEIVTGDLGDVASLQAACAGATVVVHCAAKVGDWGPTDEYRRVNVDGTKALLHAALKTGLLKRWVQISSLGVYSGGDHYGTDETTATNTDGIDGYTLTKVESEQLVCDYITNHQLPAVVLRPGFVYGPRDRTVMPRLMGKLRDRKFAYLGNHDKLMNNTFVGNLCEAVWLAIANDGIVGQVFNIRDPRAVSKKEFMDTICHAAGYSIPTKVVPLHIAKILSWHMETLWKLLRRKEAPLVNSARIKFLGQNLDFCIEKANLQLGYQPATDFHDAMRTTVECFIESSTDG